MGAAQRIGSDLASGSASALMQFKMRGQTVRACKGMHAYVYLRVCALRLVRLRHGDWMARQEGPASERDANRRQLSAMIMLETYTAVVSGGYQL
jgi:hypothetical protein